MMTASARLLFGFQLKRGHPFEIPEAQSPYASRPLLLRVMANPCPRCSAVFLTATKLRRHLDRTTPCEGAAGGPVCPACGRAFANAANLKRHVANNCAKEGAPPPLSPEEERAAAEEEQAATLERYHQALDEKEESLAALTELLTEDPAAKFDPADYPWSQFISAQTMLSLYRGEVPYTRSERNEKLDREDIWAAVKEQQA